MPSLFPLILLLLLLVAGLGECAPLEGEDPGNKKQFFFLRFHEEYWGYHDMIRDTLIRYEHQLGFKFWAATTNYTFIVSHKNNQHRHHKERLLLGEKGVSLEDVGGIRTGEQRQSGDCVAFSADEQVDIRSFFNFDTRGIFATSQELLIAERNGERNNLVIIHFLAEKYRELVLETVRSQPEILFVECNFENEKHNAFARASSLLPPQPYALPLQGGGKVVNFGQDSIVTIADTGLDINHCYFRGSTGEKVPRFTLTRRNANIVTNLLKAKNQEAPHSKMYGYLALQFKRGNMTVQTDFTDEVGGHGTHVSGSAAGNPLHDDCMDPGGEGGEELASKAKILFVDVDPSYSTNPHLSMPISLAWIMKVSYDCGSRIFSNSWGTKQNAYTFTSYQIDYFIHLHPGYSVVFSAGNSGPEPRTVGSPATAKNVISVGSTMNTQDSFKKYAAAGHLIYGNYTLDPEDVKSSYKYGSEHLSGFSSRGPTEDGRIKPDVVFPGEFILSSKAGGARPNELTLMRGTSMAAPLVTSMLTYVEEKLKKVYQIPEPTNSLKKAILITNTVALKGRSQDLKPNMTTGNIEVRGSREIHSPFDAGFGRVQLTDFIQGKTKFKHGGVKVQTYSKPTSFCLRANESISEFVITMVYDDVPTFRGLDPTRTLVNDVSMRLLVFENGKATKLLNGNFNEEGGDPLNNVEQVRVSLLAGSLVRVVIHGTGPILSIKTTKEQEQAVDVAWNAGLEEVACPTECTFFDPVYECASSRQKLCAVGGAYETECKPLQREIFPCSSGEGYWIRTKDNGDSTCLPLMKEEERKMARVLLVDNKLVRKGGKGGGGGGSTFIGLVILCAPFVALMYLARRRA